MKSLRAEGINREPSSNAALADPRGAIFAPRQASTRTTLCGSAEALGTPKLARTEQVGPLPHAPQRRSNSPLRRNRRKAPWTTRSPDGALRIERQECAASNTQTHGKEAKGSGMSPRTWSPSR
jgi:hypothetical protein